MPHANPHERLAYYRTRCRRDRARIRQVTRCRRYGITPDQFARLLLRQARRCAICRARLVDDRHLQVDHCHASGPVRGLLCSACNRLLAGARDEPTMLLRAFCYLMVPPAPAVLAGPREGRE